MQPPRSARAPLRWRRALGAGGARCGSLSSPSRVPSPLVSPRNRSFFTGDITLVLYVCIYHSTIFLKLVRFSYAYVLSLYICDYFSRKLLAKFEFPYLKARYVLFFHRKEFRRKSNGVVVEFLNHFRAQNTDCFLSVNWQILVLSSNVLVDHFYLIYIYFNINSVQFSLFIFKLL